MEIPKINERILQLIDYYTNRSVKKFAESINIPQQTVNRLFNIDTRTKKYPLATTEILVAITEMYVDINANWLLTGRGAMLMAQQSAVNTPIYSETTTEKLFAIIREKDSKIEEQARAIGRLEGQVEILSKKSIGTTVAGDATCAAVNE